MLLQNPPNRVNLGQVVLNLPLEDDVNNVIRYVFLGQSLELSSSDQY